MDKFIYNYSKSIVWNTIDYYGQEKLAGKTPMRGPSGPLRRTVHGTKVSLGQEHWKTQVNTTDCPKEKQAPSETKRGPSDLKRGPSGRCKAEKLEGDGFGKMHF
jgi:hypothetical protein